MVALADAQIAGRGVEVLVVALVTQPHLVVQRHAPRDDAAAGARAFLPIVHVVLLEGSRRAEAAHAGHPDRLLDVRRGGLIGKDPGPDLRLVGPTRMPHAEAAREAMRTAFGKQPAFVREGGSIGAVVTMEKYLKAPIVFMGLSLPEHGYHAPNENFDWEQASGGMKMFAKYFETISRV